jgi:hypothetical protein
MDYRYDQDYGYLTAVCTGTDVREEVGTDTGHINFPRYGCLSHALPVRYGRYHSDQKQYYTEKPGYIVANSLCTT